MSASSPHHGKEIEYENETWRVLGSGVDTGDSTYCHLASLTRGDHQKNGWVPHQIIVKVANTTLDQGNTP